MYRTIIAALLGLLLPLAAYADKERPENSFPNQPCYAEDSSIANGTGADFVDLRELDEFNVNGGTFSVLVENTGSEDLLIQFLRKEDISGVTIGSIPASPLSTPAQDGTPSEIYRLAAGKTKSYPGAWVAWRWQAVDSTTSAVADCNH